MPAVSVSDSFWVNVAWIENFAAPADNLARAELTLVSEVWIVAISAEALAWVEIVAVDGERHDRSPTGSDSAPRSVIRRVPSAEASAVICVGRAVDQIEAVEHGVLHDRGDLIAQRHEVRVQRLAARRIERGSRRRTSAFCFIWISRSEIDWPAESATSMAEEPRFRLLMTDGIAGHGAALVLGDGIDRAIILRRRDFEAAS